MTIKKSAEFDESLGLKTCVEHRGVSEIARPMVLRARKWWISLVLLALGRGLTAQDTYRPEDLARARQLHRENLVLDTHSDTTPFFEDPSWNFLERHPRGHMDLPRMRDGGFDAQFWSIYMGATPGDGRALKTALVRIDAVHELSRRYPNHIEVAFTAADIRRIRGDGKIASLMGIEGGHIIEDSLPGLRMLFRLGCRYMTLTHSFNTTWADSSGSKEDVVGEFQGLSARGEVIVAEMNRLGMMVDISHVADATFDDVLRVTRAPIIASHSSVRALCDHRRNLTDAQLLAIARNGGVVMINFYSEYIDPDHAARRAAWEKQHEAELTTLKTKYKANLRRYYDALSEFRIEHPIPETPLVVLAKHVEHAAKIMGWEHVGIGADWDGVPTLPADMAHCGDLPNLTALLLARGADPKNLVGFLGGNLLRVMERCEEVARTLK